MRKRLPPGGGYRKVVAAMLAAITIMAPVMTYATEMADPPSESTAEVKTNVQVQNEATDNITGNTPTADSSVEDPKTTRKLNIGMSTGGYVVLNEGLDSQETIKIEEKDGAKEFKIYDSNDVLVDTAKDAYSYEAEDSSILIVKAVAEDGYEISGFDISGEDVKSSDQKKDFQYTAVMDEDKTLTAVFAKSRGAGDLSVSEQSSKQLSQIPKETTKNTDLTILAHAGTESGKAGEVSTKNREPPADNIVRESSSSGPSNKSDSKKSQSTTKADLSVISPKTKKEKKSDEVVNVSVQSDSNCSETSQTIAEPDQTDVNVVPCTSTANTNLCYILAYEMNKIIDGTAPFDANNSAGNDSNDENGIVRSFDTINYTLKYTTAIKNAETQGIDSTNVMVDFLLPCSPIKAEFNVDTMTWLLDQKITYTYEDGSTSTIYDRNKNVVNQRLTGRRLLVNSEAGNTVPGTGTLAIGVNVNAAITGDVIKPQFTIWMEGNSENEKKTLTANTTVSAAPKYDIVIKRNGSANLLGYYNLEDKTAKTSKEKDTDKYGRLQTYVIGLAIQNDSAQKGMKGVEYPSGKDITFDLRMSEVLNGADVSKQEDYRPLLWNYAMDDGYKNMGNLGRPMAPFGQSIASVGQWTTNTPWNSGNNSGACYNGGNMVIIQDANDSNLLHVTLSGYQMDMKDFDFPVKWSGATYGSIPVNTGYFSVGLLQMIARFKTNVGVIENIGVKLEASNIHATSMSGIEVTKEVDSQNNVSSMQVTNYPGGSHSKRNFYYSPTGGYMRPTTWDAGDSYAYIGEKVLIGGHMVYTGDRYLEATNILQKIDDKAFTIPSGTTRYASCNRSNTLTEIGDITTLFAAKPNKSGWNNDDEMNNTHEEQLIYFKNIDDLTKAGYICVGMLYEIRNSKLYPNNSGGCIDIRQLLNIRSDVKTGNVYMTKNDVRSWREGTNFSYANVVYDSTIKAYGIGNSNWPSGTYVNGYTNPTYRTDLNYGKAVYKDGTMVSGHWNGYQGGNSLLIIGNKTHIGIEVADKTGDKPKSVYDLDAGERTAKFTIQPATIITSENSEVQSSDAKDNLKIEVTLPSGLHFDKNGVSFEPKSVKENTDGTTTIIWKMNNVKVGAGLDPIAFSTTIGEEGTVNDVHHNDSFTIIAKITSDNDTRKIMAANGNYAETEISVIKLAASAVTKRVLTPLVERSQDLKFRLRYSNLSDTEAINAKIYDILPYNDDGRNSAFSGSYDLKSIKIDFSNAKKTYQNGKDKIECYASAAERNKTDMEGLMQSGAGLDKFNKLGNKINDNSESTITWSNVSYKDATSLYSYLGYVFGHEYIDIYITLAPKDTTTKQQPGDLYGNNFVQYADNQASLVTSNVVKAQVVKRNLSGVAWVDTNADGIRDKDEALYKNATVQLYRTASSKHAAGEQPTYIGNGRKKYTAYDIFGKEVESIATDENGSYHFDNLESGTYYVVFSGADKYYTTIMDTGTDDTIDSDAKTEGKDIFISDIVLPSIANMSEWSFSSPNHDIGLVRKTSIEIAKIGAVTKELLAGAELGVYNASDVANGKPKKNAKPIVKWTTENGKTKMIKNTLLAGKQYTLIEAKAPADYAIADPITFTVNADGSYQKITMSDDYDTHPVTIAKKSLDGNLISGAVLKITGKEDGKTTGIDPIQWTSEAGKEHIVELRKGSYALQEVTPPAGYLATKDVDFTVDKDGNILIAGKKADKVEMTDIEVKAVKVNIRKFDSDGKTPLAGVKFELKFVSAKYPDISSNKKYSRLLKPGETNELTTDANGNISFENLDQGEYVLTETSTVAGHQLLRDSINISLPLEMTEDEVKKAENIDLAKAEQFNGLYHFYELSYEISNTASLDMPRTGDDGFWKYGVIGFGTLAVLGTGLILMDTRKKRMLNSRKQKRRRK